MGGNGQVALSWTDVCGATSYRVEYSTSPITDSSTFVRRATASTTTLTLLPQQLSRFGRPRVNSRWYFRVRARNAGGTSPRSNEVSAIPGPVPVPGAPTNLSLTPGNGQLEVSWTAVPDAAIYRARIYIAPITNSSSSIDSLATNRTSVVFTGLNNGTTYSVVVTAANALGVEGARSTASATPQP